MKTTRMSIKRWLALTVLLLACAGLAQASLIENGGFEDGLDFWDNSWDVTTANSWWGVTAAEGEMMAVMSTLGVLDSDLSQQFDPGAYDTLDISFQFNLVAFDVSWCADYGVDSFNVSLGERVWTYEIDDLFDTCSRSETTGWTLFNETVVLEEGEIPGMLSIGFHVENIPPGGGDLGQLMAAFVDDVSVVGNGGQPTAPIPDGGSTLLLVGMGLLGSEMLRRKFSR